MTSTGCQRRGRSTARCGTTVLLSHDLFEGIFARAGPGDGHRAVFDDFPSHHFEAAPRPPAPLGAGPDLAAAAVDFAGRGAPAAKTAGPRDLHPRPSAATDIEQP